jgi:hypothetical protein
MIRKTNKHSFYQLQYVTYSVVIKLDPVVTSALYKYLDSKYFHLLEIDKALELIEISMKVHCYCAQTR